ncbi:MAG: hypothetical protein ACT443_15510 [Gemmatimonadota bacterium]
MTAIGDLRAHVFAFLTLFAVAFASMLLAARQLRDVRASFAVLAAVALILRAPFLATQPTLSDDVWRYLHDGRAQLSNVSPYAFAPGDARTGPFRGAEHARINHPELVTIYPPAAQLAFRLNALLGSNLLGWRLLLIACELIALLMLARLGADRSNLVLYAWHPLAVVEVAGSAHLEPIGIALLAAGLLAAERARAVAAGVLLGLSMAVKFIAAPVLLVTTHARNGKLVAAAAAALAAVYFAYSESFVNLAVVGSLSTFAVEWEANASSYALLAFLTDGHRARILSATLLLCVMLALSRSRLATVERAAAFVFALLLLSPVAYPWYLLWLMMLITASRTGWLRTAALVWSGTIVLSYAGQTVLEYLPVYGVLMAAALARSRWRTSDPSAEKPLRIST